MNPIILLTLLLGFAEPARTAEPASLRIVCLGDSITQGRGDHSGGGGKWTPTFSYRYPLWKLLVDAGAKVDFVGSLQGGFEGDPDWADYQGRKFDRDHEGHWGWKTVDMATKLPGWIQGYTPDMALVLLGGNDVTGKTPEEHKASVERVRGAMTDIFATLRKKNPKVVILLGLDYSDWAPFPAMRSALTGLAKAQSTTESPVVIVDHSPGWVSDPKKPGTHTVDWVHPNLVGDEKLARNWFAAMKPFLTGIGQDVASPAKKLDEPPGSSALQPAIVVNVAATPRQVFSGFGFSQIGYRGAAHDAYNLTPAAQREQIADLIYTDLKTRIVRMWMGPRKDSNILAFYRDKVVPEAKAKGVTTFLLAPGVGERAPADYAKYGRDLADFIKWAVDAGLQIDVTGLNNEPSLSTNDVRGWKFDGIVTAVKELRRQLDTHQLQRIGIVAPEGANADVWLLRSVQALRADAEAWRALRGIASHSYAHAMKEEHGQVALTGNKEYWMTESSENGQENAGDGKLPYVTASRFLNDLNHGATHWVWFIGYYREGVEAKDGKTKLVNFDPQTGTITAWPKYHYLKQVLSAFPYGTVFRHCTSPTAGEMNRNGSDVSQINVATGRRPDKRLAIAVTSSLQQSVTVNIAELAGQNTKFQVLKSSVGNYQQVLPGITADHGAVTIHVGPRELITLVSED